MRTLNYKAPCKVTQTRINRERLNDADKDYYERMSVVFTKYGMVTACDFDWKTNSGKLFFTEFRTVINGMYHIAYLEEGKLSERQLKYMATQFIKKLIQP